ncbi:MAG TPA: PadR family transcriptional regulator [Sedimentisphaerales bacterium]|nr:PadR family transcriptional regulator [Sedimentisphaerales bacterium]
MIKDFFLGFIRIHILYHAAKEPVFGSALIKELARHGYCISCGTLYPILHRLHDSGYLRASKKNVGGKIRKYYRITPKGRKALRQSKSKIRELVSEVLEEK